jgi:hypothetical protein
MAFASSSELPSAGARVHADGCITSPDIFGCFLGANQSHYFWFFRESFRAAMDEAFVQKDLKSAAF